MITVLDQYEVEYKEAYISGSYDQVVMGRMFYKVQQGGIKKYFYGNRGVVYGNINSRYAPTPGTGELDASSFVSYRLQPYKEKAGNCKSAKHICYEERIYDTLLPNPISCFKIDGAEPAMLIGGYTANPGLGSVYSGAEVELNAILMFDNYTRNTSYDRSVLNPIVDNTWTRAYPFEPNYSNVKRQLTQNFTNINAKYACLFSSSLGAQLSFVGLSKPKMKGIILGTLGPRSTSRTSYSNDIFQNEIYHHWFTDTDLSKTYTDFVNTFPATGSLLYNDTLKVIFGFGDGISVHYDNNFLDSNDQTGYARRGTNNLPTFRETVLTSYRSAYDSVPPNEIYEQHTGSLWCKSPIIRGWKYGIYNGLPEYTSAYYRQGHYGQFRDMLEQRTYTCVFNEKQQKMQDPIVNIKFLDQDENLTNPDNTDSQNLSMFATSSLPFFDLTQRNRPENTLYVKNLSLVKLNFDANTNLII